MRAASAAATPTAATAAAAASTAAAAAAAGARPGRGCAPGGSDTPQGQATAAATAARSTTAATAAATAATAPAAVAATASSGGGSLLHLILGEDRTRLGDDLGDRLHARAHVGRRQQVEHLGVLQLEQHSRHLPRLLRRQGYTSA